MDKNFIQFQANAYKNLVELFNYKFTSEGKEFNLIDFVKSQILNKTYIPVASEIIAEKENNNWLKQRISIEYFDILKNADNFDVVCDKFVELYNTYLLYKDEKELVTSVFYYNELEFTLRENDIDAEKIGFLYNPVLKKSIKQDSIEFKEQDYSRYRSLAQSFSKTLTFNDTFKEKGKNIVVLSESNKTILLNQSGVKGVIPLESNFLFNPQDTNKQIEVNLTQYVDSGYDYTKDIDNIDNVTENNKLFNELLQIKDSVKSKFNSKFGSYYIDKINKENLLQSDYKFYILSSIKDSKDKFVNASVNLIFNKERTVSAVLNAYDFYYAVNIFQRFDTDVTFDIFYDNENESVVFVGNRTQFVKVPVGFNQVTSTIEYANKEVSFILTLPTQKDYGNVIKDVWLYSFSLSTTLKEIIEFTKEGEDIQKIRIPSDFLNQKDIIQKEQLFKIETVEEKLNNVKLTGKDFLDRIVQYAEEYVLTYSQKTFKTVKADDGTMKTVFESFEPVTTDKRFFIQGTQTNTDYVWKVNEIFWRYNKNISIREMIAYFVSKGDDYHYRLLSYRILGIDCYLLKEKLEEQLIKEMLVCVEDFAINVRNKTIDKPLKITYKYEYATGNYYQKRQKLRPSDVDSLEVYPMRESIMLYYGEDLGENIIQNQISFLENELIKPKEMTWNSKSEQTKLYSHPLDPIFARDNYIKKKNSYSSNIIVTEFNNFIRSTNLVNTQLSKDDIKFAYTLRLPESISIPLQFIKEFNCFKVSILPKESDKNKKGADVFAVFGQNDTKNENPLFIGDDSVNSQSCKDWINSKPYNGSIRLNRKYAKNGDSLGTYAFTKKLDRLTDDSFDNLYEGRFISVDERDDKEVEPANKKIIVNEILIAFNTKQPKAIIEGDIQFNNFMKNYVDDIDALKFQKIWNETYNYIMYPKKMDNVEGYDVVMKLDNSKFPIFIEHSRFFKDKLSNEFMLNDNQIDGIKFHIGNSSSSLLAHEVGFGKTTTSICSISHNFLTGKAKRTLISVPNPTYVNWITEIKGQSLSNGKSLKGLLPQINVVELGNARKDIFLRYDAKTFTQTGGIKKYTRSQIQNIHNFKDVTSFVNSQIKRVGSIYFSDYSDKKENVEGFLKFVEKTFDEKLSDWRTESFFTDYFDEIRTASSNYNSMFRTDLSEIENDEDNTIQRINDNSRINSTEKSSQENKAREKFEKKKNKLFEASVKNFTNQVISIINSKSTSIFDFIGVYDECFLKNYTIIISTHQAIGQLRIDKDTAIDIARELKDEQPIRLATGGLETSEFGSSLLKNAIGFDKLNIDSIIVDEVHNFNELFAYTKKQISSLVPATRRKTYYLANDYPFEALSDTGSPYFTKKGRGSNLSSIIKFNVQGKKTSNIKSTLFGIAKKLQKNKENINIMLLSATPFVDNLYQMIGVFNLLRNFQQPITFFSNYLYQEWDWENDQRGNTVLKVQTSNFKNHEARNNWIKMFSQFYTFDKRISEQRPQKFIYPFDSKNQSNQYEDNCNTNVYLDFSPEQFNIYQNLGKYVDGSLAYGNIVPSVKPTVKITKEVYINPDDLKDVKDYINPTSDYYDLEQASQVFIMNNWIDVLNDKSNPFQKDIIDIYDVIKDEIDRLSSDEEEGKSLTDGEEEVVDVNDSDQYQGIGMDTQGTRALRGQDIGKKLALSPYMVTPEGAEDEGTINPDLPTLYGMNTPDNLIKSAINFVETSPKIYFVVKSIECLIKKQQENNEDITGQIIYMTIGQNFWYGGVKYNGMELIKAYLKNSLGFNNKFVAEEIEELASSSSTKCGTIADVEFKTESKIKKYDLDEVQILSGQSQDALKKNAIAKSFNDGRIKILIGSSTIKEGINLQGSGTHGNSTIYILTADYAPMDFMQLEGRIWRQGNPLENVRIVYTLIKNSIDSHIYSKLNEKIKKVKNMLEAGVYDFKETQFDKDIEGVSLALNSNIDEKVKIMWSKETKKIEKKSKEYDDVNTRLNKIKSIYSEANNSLNDLLICYNAVAKGLQDYYVGSYIRSEYSTVRSKISAEYTSKRAELAEKLNNKFKADILEWEKLKEENEKLNKENKVKKLPKVDFNIDKPVKKDNPLYTPDYTNLELQEDKDLADAKIEVIKNNEQKVADKKFTEDEITYYVPLTAASSYSEISSSLNSLLNDLTVIRIKILDSDEYRVINSQISVSGRYFVLESKSLMIDYAFTNIIRDSSNSGIDNRMASVIKKYKLEGVAGMELFKDFAKLFINGGIFEIIFSDYQTLVSGVGETIATIDNVISGISFKINTNNALLSAKNEFYSKYRAIFIEEEDKIKKERESLTNMKQYILVDVNKFCETNKFIYLRGKYTEEQKKDMFKIKK